MAWSFQEYQEFLDAFYQHPEWQDQLRQLILTRELLHLPAGFEELRRAQQLTEQSLRELTEAQKRTDEQLRVLTQRVDALTEAQKRTDEQLRVLTQRVDALTEAQKRTDEQLRVLTQRVDALTEAQKRTDEQLRVLTQRVDALTEAQKRTEQRVAELAEAQKKSEERLTRSEERLTRLEQTVAELAEVQKKLVEDVGELRGDMLEIRYRQRAFSYLGQIASRIKVVDLQDVLPEVEPYLNDKEYEELLALDVLVSGRLRASLAERIGESSIWIAIEVSGVVDKGDVERARKRADLLSRANLKVLPLAAGQHWTKGAWDAASELGVVLQQDGKLELLEAALEKLMPQNGARPS